MHKGIRIAEHRGVLFVVRDHKRRQTKNCHDPFLPMRRLAYNLYFFPEIFETRQRDMKKFPCQPSLPTLFLFYITAAEIRKGTSELVYPMRNTVSSNK